MDEKQMQNAEQVSMQIIMRIRQIIQEMSRYSKYLLENSKNYSSPTHLPPRSLSAWADFNRCSNQNRLSE